MVAPEPRPSTVHVPDGILADLRERLARTRWPDEVTAAGWRYGTELTCLRDLCEHWREILRPPRAWAERAFDIRRWTRMPRGGHFAALEAPDLLAEDVRAFFKPLR